MGNSIVGAVFLAVVLLTLRAPVKHSRGESGCCGGGGEPKGKRKKLRGPAAAEKVLRIEGMHCETAKNRVERLLDQMDGAAAKADLILVLDKKLSKLFIAPQARQELMRRLLRQTAAKGRR